LDSHFIEIDNLGARLHGV